MQLLHRIQKKRWVFLLTLVIAATGYAQPAVYTTGNGHAHNDYEHNIPFLQAYQQGFGSIEADVLLINDSLFVAHDTAHISRNQLFATTYLQPLAAMVTANKGYAYADTGKQLILLIDLKTPAIATLNAVIKAITAYPGLTKALNMRFVITGNQPPASAFNNYPGYIYFDGDISNEAHTGNTGRIALFSANFKQYSKWNGKGLIPAGEQAGLKTAIDKVHALHKPIRFWGCPDNSNTWHTFIAMGIDYINTDKVVAFAQFISTLKQSTAVAPATGTLSQP